MRRERIEEVLANGTPDEVEACIQNFRDRGYRLEFIMEDGTEVWCSEKDFPIWGEWDQLHTDTNNDATARRRNFIEALIGLSYVVSAAVLLVAVLYMVRTLASR